MTSKKACDARPKYGALPTSTAFGNLQLPTLNSSQLLRSFCASTQLLGAKTTGLRRPLVPGDLWPWPPAPLLTELRNSNRIVFT